MVPDYLAVTALCGVMFLHVDGAGAVTLAQLNTGSPLLQLCPKPSCPAVAAGLTGSRGMIPVLIFSGSFARVGPCREAAPNLIAAAPAEPLAELTPRLMDKRLQALPSRVGDDYTLAQVVALRRHGIAYLEDGACIGIKEGAGRSRPGFSTLAAMARKHGGNSPNKGYGTSL
jgi:hypothetical protein